MKNIIFLVLFSFSAFAQTIESVGLIPFKTKNMTSATADMGGVTKSVVVNASGEFGVQLIGAGSNRGTGTGWDLTGNAGTSSASNFIGTTDLQSLIFKTNNIEGARINNVNVFSTVKDAIINRITVGTGSGNDVSNTALGFNSLLFNNGGISNTSVGSEAMRTNTSGINNVGLGFASLYENVIGNRNVGLGFRSLYSNKSSDNVSVGYHALYGNTTGSYNIAIGSTAGEGITTGSNNVIIGGYNGVNIATTSNLMLFALGNGIERFRVSPNGNMIVGTDIDSPSAILKLESVTQGFLPPRMTQAQRNAIVSPQEGLIIYQNDGLKGWYGWDGSMWYKM